MQTLIVVDAQNEFSPQGRRPVPNHVQALEAIHRRVEEARREGRPIAWVRHHNPPGAATAPLRQARGARSTRQASGRFLRGRRRPSS